MIDVLTDLLSGQRVSRSRAQEAVNELFAGGWDIGGFMASGYMPGIPHDAPRTGPFAGAFPGAGHQRATVDPELAQLLEARRRARVVLGFAESEPVTKQTLKARHRELVRKHHPDHGGSVEKMKMVNAAKDVLEAEIA